MKKGATKGMKKGHISIDVDKCVACRTCELQCAVAHSKSKELLAAIKEKPKPQRRVRIEAIGDLPVPLICRHCDAAPCVTVCPTGALEKLGLDGPVAITRNLCVGCGSCTIACPYGIPRRGIDGKAIIKCDLCIERLKKGEIPACAKGCPTGSIKFIPSEE
jgi:carbon-monoxide dehydrogenase iron sulfur subunit